MHVVTAPTEAKGRLEVMTGGRMQIKIKDRQFESSCYISINFPAHKRYVPSEEK